MFNYEDEFKKSQKSPYFKATRAILDVVCDALRIMKKKQISKKMLAEKMGVSPAYITKIMRGDSNLSIETIAKVAVALDCDLRSPVIYEIEQCDIDLCDFSRLNYEQENGDWKISSIENVNTIYKDNYAPYCVDNLATNIEKEARC